MARKPRILWIKVERSVTQPPPHRSRRAVLPHRALRICSLTHWQTLYKEFQLLTWVLFSNLRSRYQKLVQQVFESGPVVTQPLTTPVEPFKQYASSPVVKCLQTAVITDNTIIVPVPAVLGPKGCHQFGNLLVTFRFYPFCKCGDWGSEFLPRCSSSDDRLEIAADRTAKFKS